MKKELIIIITILLCFFSKKTYAIENNTIEDQIDNFDISDFIKESKNYYSNIFDETDISSFLNQAIKGKIDNNTIGRKLLELFEGEFIEELKVFISILVIILIHSILKSISDSLENKSVSQIIYYVQYILIITIITKNFADTINIVNKTADSLVGFINSLIPLLISLMLFTGSIATSSAIEPTILFMINFLGNIINIIIIPIISIIAGLSIISKISDKVQIEKLTNFLRKSVEWTFGIILTLFVATISLEGTLSSSIDGISAKTAKAAVSNIIPVVGKVIRRCC